MRLVFVVLLFVSAMVSGVQSAPIVNRADEVHGIMAFGAGELSGRVIDEGGDPISAATVYVVTASSRERTVRTGADGKFKLGVEASGTWWAYVRGGGKIVGAAIVSSQGDGEIIEIHEVVPPAVLPKPRANPLAIPPYSDEAIEHNTWARAWLLLDVDTAGKVQRVKLISSPGFGLDPIAVREAFELRFDPALDLNRKPASALIVWTFEWPAHQWLIQHRGVNMRRMPADVGKVPCRGTGPTHSTYRDCSRPKLGTMMAQPWIERPSK